MSKWAGKYVIGLTGNIGTGKSVVRRMLEHLGAYGIDADALAHRAIAKDAPGHQPVIKAFGRWVIGSDGQIDRAKLAKIVFSDPAALAELEAIIHPLVEQAIDLLIRRAPQTVVVVEAIKLLEANLHRHCDSVWVTYTKPEIQISRLVSKRHITENEARQRMAAQPPQEQKISAAQVVIKNESTFEDTWGQVVRAWQKIGHAKTSEPATQIVNLKLPQQEISVFRGKPRHSAEIAALFNRLHKEQSSLQAEDIMAAFGEKAFLMVQIGSRLMGVLGWQVENLVARTTEMVLDPAIPVQQVLPVLITEMERASKDLQCEASLVFVPLELAKSGELWRTLGYEPRTPEMLGVQAWQEAAQESLTSGAQLFFKQLRQDRVLRPI